MDIIWTSKFKRDYKKITKQKKDIELLRKVLNILAAGDQLPQNYLNHPLMGQYNGYQECHIPPDWLLIYQYTEDTLVVYRTGSHSELF